MTAKPSSWHPDGGFPEAEEEDQNNKLECTDIVPNQQAQVVKEFDNYKLDILRVSEARWTGAGKKKLASGHTILFSGRSDNQHTQKEWP